MKLQTFCFDIDGTLTIETDGFGDDVYSRRTPRIDMIEKLKELYRADNFIILYSARPQADYKVTVRWLEIYNIPYHELVLGKPEAGQYIDDKSITPNEFLL